MQSGLNSSWPTVAVAVDVAGFDGSEIAADAETGFSGCVIGVDAAGFAGIGFVAAAVTGFAGNKVADFSAHTGIAAVIAGCSY